MAQVAFTRNLQRFFPDLEETEVPAQTVAALIQALDQRWPKLSSYLVDDQGRLRRHVNIFVDEVIIRDRETLSDTLHADAKVFIVQALSGG
ncbi:MoaD/ThiS family protein [Acanthopleuribacter pedis]|uniref:MoaD/ThiS family protein n=1 Tax=Acanthopleuribacter pedis TaxID=442870 RepID=A0A8J7QGX6_9BACT|nr:MoaD/ThiS family protein [Acanthopleuribacter pedis]MBO1322155.1 MoaD/ThiS family protein [Acanthopleuribacter pedis]